MRLASVRFTSDTTVGVVALAAVLAAGCGKKGPPLPPLIKLPAAPADFTAVRRGDGVDLRFTVPSANTDNTRPANVQRVDVYAWSGPLPPSDAEIVRRGAKVASIAVKAPRDPDLTTDPEDPEEEAEPLEGSGLDQGAAAYVEERLTAESLGRSDQGRDAKEQAPSDEGPSPLVGRSMMRVPSRTYVGVSINKSGRTGPASKRVSVPLVPPPPAPAMLTASYDESAVTLTWTPSRSAAALGQAAGAGLLPSRPIGMAMPKLSYTIYELTPSPAGGSDSRRTGSETLLTKTPLIDTRFSDPRMTWGATRCYAVRAVESIDSWSVESDAREPTCVALKDTFAPAAPKNLMAVASEGAISLIWDPNNEQDLDGYLVLRGAAPGGPLTSITPRVIHETTFHDRVPRGAQYVYAVQAVDTAGNISPSSTPVEETAR